MCIRDSIITACKKVQMSQIIRFVEIKHNSIDIKEAFIDFIPLEVKTAEGITEAITSKLGRDGLNLSGCRGQSYDNQSTMAGIHSGCLLYTSKN